MKPSATGRILMWRGGSLWIGLAGEPSGFHSHHAVQITLPFPQCRARLRLPAGDWNSYTAAIVAAHQKHAFDARDQFVAQLFVEPESREGRSMQSRYRDDGIAALPTESLQPLVAALAAAYAEHAADVKLTALARAAIAAVAGAGSTAEKSDPRIVRALELIRARLGDAVSLKSIAAEVHLSPDRFRHLFMEQTNVAFRAYVLWLRLESALAAYVSGKSLTEAAHAGGFADSAHLSRTFRRMFGIAPASIRPE